MRQEGGDQSATADIDWDHTEHGLWTPTQKVAFKQPLHPRVVAQWGLIQHPIAPECRECTRAIEQYEPYAILTTPVRGSIDPIVALCLACLRTTEAAAKYFTSTP